MAVAAETFEIAESEVYARSLRSIRAMGELAVEKQIGTPEYIGAEVEAFSDFVSALGENLATDQEFGKRLNFDRVRELRVVNGQTVDETGRPVRQIVKEGWLHSIKAAVKDERMAVQADRDEADFLVAGIVEGLEVGEMYAVLSFEPKQQLEQDPAFWTKMGYRKGMAVAQVYYRLPNGNIFAGAYSIKGSSLDAGRQILLEEGTVVPEEESANRMIRYGIRKSVDEQTARGFGKQLRVRHNKLAGNSGIDYSVTDFIEENNSEVKAYFDAYIRPLSEACATGVNNVELQSFATTIQRVVGANLGFSARQQLMRIVNDKAFSDDDGRFMENYIRYGIVEILRAKLPFSNAAEYFGRTKSYVNRIEVGTYYHSVEAMNLQMAGAMNNGIEAKRSYGGCSGTTMTYETDLNDPLGSQDVYGGRLNKQDEPEKKENWRWKKGVCRVEKCPTRPSETEVGPCDVCRCCQIWFDKGRDPAKLYGGVKGVIKREVNKPNSNVKTVKIQKARDNG